MPHALLVDVAETMARYGRLRLEKHPVHGLVLVSNDRPVLEEVLRAKKIAGMIGARIDADTVVVHPSERGNLKQALLKIGWPAEDFAGYVDGEAHAIELDESDWSMRPYQKEAVESFWHGGSGVVVLPCGAGKTHGRRGRDGRGEGDHADPGHQHRQRAAVEGRADAAHVADRRGDRRVQRLGQGDPPRHHRDVPGDDDAPEGRLHATSSCSTPATGA